MISPHTPPGTPLVVVWATSDRDEIIGVFRPEYRGRLGNTIPLDPEIVIWVGQRVVLTSITPCEFLVDGYTAEIAERPGENYPLKCFDIAALPQVLLDLQAPAREDA